ncbi:hypothetical protein PYW08_012716 [Mythimna loreyi]|uniref:Uncharacterized protein n=1 Tax=Mythimna loreyi TaxID=667449 RepID=A0ACC2Q1I2_9NEOP|nr:hypothetical protein PYW08_012716 [Mythimna loreyi]
MGVMTPMTPVKSTAQDLLIADKVQVLSGSVTLISSAATGTSSLEAVTRERGCVAARFGDLAVVGVYLSPNRPLADLHDSPGEWNAFVVGFDLLPEVVCGELNITDLAWSFQLRN